MRKLFCLLAIACLFFSCKKSSTKAVTKVEFYLLDSFQPITGKCQVNPSSAELKAVPFIRNEDIISYSQTNYTYTLSATAIQTIKDFAGRIPFAATVDNEVVFYGFYNEPILSSSCDHSISMDFDWITNNKIVLRLGYPGLLEGVTIDDQRNNSLLIATLKNQGKWMY